MSDTERERIREALIFEYRLENQDVLGMSDEELASTYNELKKWEPHVN